ncbi:MAG TPA: GNAT family N-acetyltransferase [Candidatus Hydrogenedentes bacterium]|nr:GNAT family N-acetyltransferase [Candidatus Hydrogenedentota bacterium]HRK33812.1 GNAT family N-acetyltransferase [Candidatus Hydrogenedentota bacterium]
MQYSIEQRGPEAIDDLYDMILACGEDMWSRLGLDHWRPPTPKETYRTYARTRRVFAVIDHGVAIATFTLGEEQPEPYPDSCWEDVSHRALYLVKLAVHPGAQQRGLGRWCMECIEGLARMDGYDAVRFDALTRNAPLLGFYDHLGYRRCGEMYVLDEIDRGWDIVVYEKVICGIAESAIDD